VKAEQYIIIDAVAAHVRVGYIAQWEVRQNGVPVRGYAKGNSSKGRIEGFFNIGWPGQTARNSGIDILSIKKVA
jgi:hypothetical protein